MVFLHYLKGITPIPSCLPYASDLPRTKLRTSRFQHVYHDKGGLAVLGRSCGSPSDKARSITFILTYLTRVGNNKEALVGSSETVLSILRTLMRRCGLVTYFHGSDH
jgi:hypothetical protein